MPSLEDFLAVGPQQAPSPASPQGAALPPQMRHLSATSVSMFMRCPEQFRRRYILGEKERPGAALIVGGGFHFAQEHNFRQKIDSGEDLSVEECVEAFHHGWDAKVEENGGADEVEWDARLSASTLRQRGAELTKSYRLAVAPKMQPVAVEREFNLVVPGIELPFNGYIDFEGEIWPSPLELAGEGLPDIDGNPIEWLPPVDADGVINPRLAVVDYKTANAAKRELKPEWKLQARLYQLETGKRVEYHVAVKTKEPQIITPVDEPALGIDPSEQGLATTARLLERVSKQIAWHYAEFGPDQAWPGAITHPWACGYCGFRPNCIWVQG